MQYLTLSGRKRTLSNARRYVIDWDGNSLSKFQFDVKQFLRRYWEDHVVYEEFPVVGTRMKIDIYNATKRVAVECDGAQHGKFNRHFHNNSLSVYHKQRIRDWDKDKWCELNRITIVRIEESDLVDLSAAWFQKHYEISLHG